MIELGLHHLCALEVGPIEFAELARDNGFQRVSTFTQQLGNMSQFPLVTQANHQQFTATLRDAGLQLVNVECFMLVANTRIADYRPALELGQAMNAIGATVLVYDADESRVLDNLTQFCELAKSCHLRVNLELMALTPAYNRLPDLLALIEKVGADNLGLGLDILHLVRSGTKPEQVAQLDPKRVHYMQLCDGLDLSVSADYSVEAGSSRLAPGEGKFPIREFIDALPKGTLLELEVPQPADNPVAERIRHIAQCARKAL